MLARLGVQRIIVGCKNIFQLVDYIDGLVRGRRRSPRELLKIWERSDQILVEVRADMMPAPDGANTREF